MIYNGYKIEVEVNQYLTFELTEDGHPNPKVVTSEDGWDITGYYYQNIENRDQEGWYHGHSLEKVKQIIDEEIKLRNSFKEA